MRGEYSRVRRSVARIRELPPRARRIQKHSGWGHDYFGTTSACAENTFSTRCAPRDTGNYLRVRGEYQWPISLADRKVELPPRARRIRGRHGAETPYIGTTSACAENSTPGQPQILISWNYLRVRGEYISRKASLTLSAELPPRARRIRAVWLYTSFPPGTTSACAENTLNELGLL